MAVNKFGKKQLGEILIEEGVLKRGDLQEALAKQSSEGGLIGAILVGMRAITEEELLVALSKQLKIPFIRVSCYDVNQAAMKLIPREVAERFLIFPFEQNHQKISFAMADPLNPAALEAIEKRVPFPVQIFLATVTELRKAIEFHYDSVVTEEKKDAKWKPAQS